MKVEYYNIEASRKELAAAPLWVTVIEKIETEEHARACLKKIEEDDSHIVSQWCY